MSDKNTEGTEPKLSYHGFASYEPSHLKNQVTIDALLGMFHAAASDEGIGPTKLGYLKSLIAGRYVEAQIESMDRLTQAIDDASKSNTDSVNKLTDALNKASCSSNFVGACLLVATIAGAIIAYLKG